MTLEEYLGKSLDELTWVRNPDKFISAEQYTLEKHNLSLIDYLVIAHNERNKSLRDLEVELGIYRQALAKVFDNLELPRPTRIESVVNKYQDPIEGPKLTQKIKDRYNDPEYLAKIKKSIKEAQSTPEAKARQSKISKKRWADPAYYKRVMPKIQSSLHEKWENDSEYRENVLEGGKKFNQNQELREKTNKKLSELGKARYASDPKYAEQSREQMKKNWQDPKIRENMLKFLQERAKDPVYIEIMRQNTSENWKNQEIRERRINGMKMKFETDTDYKKRVVERLQSPEMRAKVSEALLKRWEDPKYKSRISQLMSDIMLEKMKDPKTRKMYQDATKKLWEDPEHREKHNKMLKKLWENPEYREKMSNLMIERWADPESREELLVSIQEGISEFWNDPQKVASWLEKITPERREQMSERMRQIANRLWSDPEHRQRVVNGDRRAWRRRGYADSRNENLPTHSGYRRDIGFNAKSCWEANIARIFLYCNRNFERNLPLEIGIEEEYQDIFEPGISTFFVDFVTTNQKGFSKTYEIVSHYFENPKGISKAQMLLNQYPNMPIRIINQKTYRRLANHFKDKINESHDFIAWEDTDFNIKTNPEEFA